MDRFSAPARYENLITERQVDQRARRSCGSRTYELFLTDSQIALFRVHC